MAGEVVLVYDEEEGHTSAGHTPDNQNRFIRAIVIFLLSWQFRFGVPDTGMAALLMFMYHILFYISKITKSPIVQQLATTMPRSVAAAQRAIGAHEDSASSYVVCTKCHLIYNHQDCYQDIRGGKQAAKVCQHISFPNHPHSLQRNVCGTNLLASIRGRNGLIHLQPITIYAYQSIIDSLRRLFRRPGFLESCDHWKTRQKAMPNEYVGDVYDGNLWKHFESINFFSTGICLLFALNVDWFNPFSRLQYSVGAIYLTIQNLPRNMRYKMENVILVGIIPGPKEPKLTINSYLAPLVEELKNLWKGVVLDVGLSSLPYISVRGALMCVSCDIPATRKVLGFVGHSAILGCSKCLKQFKSSEPHLLNYSGFDPAEKRSICKHKKACKSHLTAETRAKQISIEQEFGVRYSVLLQLEYFNPIKMHVIDPMHNLLLGTAKHAMEVWLKQELILPLHFSKISSCVARIQCPRDIGRLPIKITSSFSGFTADQWKAWVLIFSPVVLKGILPTEHMHCWLIFVKACRLVCTRLLKKDHIRVAHQLFLLFCKKFEELYGWQQCTPNMHMHTHLRDCLEDYGPVYAFWCYAFERYNGILGSYHTNYRNIGKQIMKKFIREQSAKSAEMPKEFAELDILMPSNTISSPSADSNVSDRMTLLKVCFSTIGTSTSFAVTPAVTQIGNVCHKVLEAYEAEGLQQLYQELYPNLNLSLGSLFYKKSFRASIAGVILESSQISSKNSVVMAVWQSNSLEHSSEVFGVVQHFIHHTLSVHCDNGDDRSIPHIFAYVKWFKKHESFDYFGSSATVVTEGFEPFSPFSFIPVQKIRNRCAHGSFSIDFGKGFDENVAIVIPLPSELCI